MTADQAYELAGLAAQAGDAKDCARWTRIAKRLDAGEDVCPRCYGEGCPHCEGD